SASAKRRKALRFHSYQLPIGAIYDCADRITPTLISKSASIGCDSKAGRMRSSSSSMRTKAKGHRWRRGLWSWLADLGNQIRGGQREQDLRPSNALISYRDEVKIA